MIRIVSKLSKSSNREGKESIEVETVSAEKGYATTVSTISYKGKQCVSKEQINETDVNTVNILHDKIVEDINV